MRSTVLFLLACTLGLAACSSPAAQLPYVSIAAATLADADPVPPPAGDVVLGVSGAVAKSNADDSLELDLATIERMGLVRYVVHDPWLDEDLEFTGVLLSDFLDVVGASDSATVLKFHAMDDYEVEVAVADVEKWPIMLATRTNGEPMSIEDKGPTRVVFPYDQFPEIDQLTYKDLWVWNIDAVTVR